MTNPAKKEELLKSLHARNITRFNVQGSEFIATVTPDIEVSDLLDPKFWTHVSGQHFMGELNYVHVMWEDKSQLAKLYVVEYENTYARMELLEHYDFRDQETSVASIPKEEVYEASWGGPTDGFRIIRVADGNLMNPDLGIRTKAAAAAEMDRLKGLDK